MKDRFESRGLQAYFSVEAALIFPLCLFLLFLTAFLFVCQYDRCLMEQDAGILALYCSTMDKFLDTETQRRLIRQKIAESSEDKYVLWDMDSYTAELRSGYAEVSCCGHFRMPIQEWNPLQIDSDWNAQYSCRLTRNTPIDYLRVLNKLSQDK